MPRPYLQAILAIALGLAASYFFMPGSQQNPEVSAWQMTLPKTYLVNTRTSTYSNEGALTDVLEAKLVAYYPATNQALMDSPRLYSHNLNDDTWSAASDIGRFELESELLTLTKNVTLTNDTNQVILNTQKMSIDFRKNIATSKVPVTITHGDSSTRADGMIADLDAQTVRLQPNVESVYVKPNP